MINIPKGTKDVLPFEAYQWHYVESVAKEVARIYCFNEIRTPVFEHTELFLRGVGETTDIVSKEMYTFFDKGNRSITLKPEGTAGVARSYVENSLYALPQPIRTFYITPVFRYERPQAGRLREHHQFGVEMFGSDSSLADVEIISIAKNIFERLGIEKLELYINSIGCPNCRKIYNLALQGYLESHLSKMCPVCKDRFNKNPLRILDCKEAGCIEINKDAPIILDFICEDCKNHHNSLMAGLTASGINFKVNPRIVRGLDYYTKTVFEFVSTDIGAQGTVCGGGRYNNLVEEVGGKPSPAVGFGMGIERLLLTLTNLGLPLGTQPSPDIYIAGICEDAQIEVLKLAKELRAEGVSVEFDLLNRSLKAQMKYADKQKAKCIIIIGEDELKNRVANLKNMQNGETKQVNLDTIGKSFKELK